MMASKRHQISLLIWITLAFVGSITRSTLAEKALLNQIMIDPERPDKLVYNRDANQDGRLDPAFLCGPGGPEGFLYGDISGGDTPDTVLDKMIRHGGNCIYIQGIRSHGGDGQAHHNPFAWIMIRKKDWILQSSKGGSDGSIAWRPMAS